MLRGNCHSGAGEAVRQNAVESWRAGAANQPRAASRVLLSTSPRDLTNAPPKLIDPSLLFFLIVQAHLSKIYSRIAFANTLPLNLCQAITAVTAFDIIDIQWLLKEPAMQLQVCGLHALLLNPRSNWSKYSNYFLKVWLQDGLSLFNAQVYAIC